MKIYELPYELMPLEKDVMTLDEDLSFRNLILGYNYQVLTMVKHSIQRLEALYGKIPLKFSKGVWSCMILDGLQGKEPKVENEKTTSEIDALVIIDRTVDLFTLLLTQFTYEGVIDEFFSIHSGMIKVSNKILDPESAKEEEKDLFLYSADDIMFSETRDFHFNLLKVQIPKKYAEIKSFCAKRTSAKTISEVTEYFKRLKSFKIPQLKNFFNTNINLLSYLDSQVRLPAFKKSIEMAFKIITSHDFPKDVVHDLETEIAKCTDRKYLLKNLCLLSLINNGIPKDIYNLLTREFVDAFGISEMLRLLNLERTGILRRDKTIASWKAAKGLFGLINENVEINDKPTNIAYSYNNYAPLSVKLVAKILEDGWCGSDGNFYKKF